MRVLWLCITGIIVCTSTLVYSEIGNFTAIGKPHRILLEWINTGSDNVVVVRSMDDYPDSITDGIGRYEGTGTEYIDEDVIPEICYYYTLFCDYGSFTATATPTMDDTPPSAPGTPTEELLDTDMVTYGTWTVFWGSATEDYSSIIRYELQVSINDGTWTVVDNNIPGNVGSYTYVFGISGNKYEYRIRAQNDIGLWGTYSTVSDGIRVVEHKVVLPATSSILYTGLNNQQIIVDVPVNAYPEDVTCGITQLEVEKDNIKIHPPIKCILGKVWQVIVVSGTNTVIQPVDEITMIMSYPDPNIEDEVVDVERYRIYHLEEDNVWRIVSDNEDEVQNVLSAMDMIQVKIDNVGLFMVAEVKDVIPPKPVSNLSVTGSEHEVVLRWNNPEYDYIRTEIVRKEYSYPETYEDGVLIYSGTATEYIDTEVVDATTYYYAVYVYDGTNYSVPIIGSATVKDITPPGCITEFRAIPGCRKIVLQWSNPDDIDYIRTDIIRKIDEYPVSPVDGVKVYSGTNTIYEDLDVVDGILYCYTAFAYDGVNYSTISTGSYCSAVPTIDTTPPSIPGTPTESYPDIDMTSTGDWMLIWQRAYDEESQIAYYELEERVNNGTWTWIRNIAGSHVSLSMHRYDTGNIYYYRLRAVNGDGIAGSYSVSSDGIRVVNTAVVLPATSSIIYKNSINELTIVDVPIEVYPVQNNKIVFGISCITPPETELIYAKPPIERLLCNAWKIEAIDEYNNDVEPEGTITIIISYIDPDNMDEISDVERYRMYKLNKKDNIWEQVAVQYVDSKTNRIKVKVNTLAVYVIAELRDIEPPDKISNFTVVAREHDVVLSWANPPDKDYKSTRIVRRTDRFPEMPEDGDIIYTGTGTEYIDTDVVDNTTYYYTAFAYDGTNYSQVVTGSCTVVDRIAPASICNFAAIGKMGRIELSWNNPADSDFYRVEIIRSTIDFPTTPTGYVSIYTGTQTSYVDTEVVNGLVYYYTGFAYDKLGNISNIGTSSCGSATPISDNTSPSAPGTITEGFIDTDVVIYPGTWSVYWQPAEDKESRIILYELQQKINDGIWETISATITSNSIGWANLTGIPGNTYFYRIRAMNETGLWGTYTVSDGIRVIDVVRDVRSVPQIEWNMIDKDDVKHGITVDISGAISEGLITVSRVVVEPMLFRMLGNAYQVVVINDANEEIQPEGSLTISIFYPDPDFNNEDEDMYYRIYYFDKDNNIWRVVPGKQDVLPAENRISVKVSRLSIYAVGTLISKVSDDIVVYPNPYSPERYGHERVIFTGWQGCAKIWIYKLNGELIKEMYATDGIKEWIPVDDIASGVYIYVVKPDNGRKYYGKIAIIR